MNQEQNHNEFDDQFKQMLDGHEMNGTDELWDEINQTFPEIDSENENRRKIVFLKWFSAGAVLLFLMSVFYYEWKLNTIEQKYDQLIVEMNPNSSENEDELSSSKNITANNDSNSDKIDSTVDNAASSAINNKSVQSVAEKDKETIPKSNSGIKASTFSNPKTNKYVTSTPSSKQSGPVQGQTTVPQTHTTEEISSSKADVANNTIEVALLDNGTTQKEGLQNDSNNLESQESEIFLNYNDSLLSEKIGQDSVPDTSPYKVDSLNTSVDSLITESIQVKDSIPEKKKKPKIKPENRFSGTIFISPDYSYRRLTDNHDYTIPNATAQDLNSVEKGKLTYSGGVKINYALTNKTSVYSGIQYHRYRQSLNTDISANFLDTTNGNLILTTSLGKIDFNANSGESGGNEGGTEDILSFQSVQSISSFTLPIGIQYSFDLSKKQKLYLQSEFNLNFILSGNSTLILSKKAGGNEAEDRSLNKQKIQGLAKTNIGVAFGIGYELEMNKKLSLILNPIFKTALTPVNTNYSVKSYPYSFGFHTGLKLKL